MTHTHGHAHNMAACLFVTIVLQYLHPLRSTGRRQTEQCISSPLLLFQWITSFLTHWVPVSHYRTNVYASSFSSLVMFGSLLHLPVPKIIQTFSFLIRLTEDRRRDASFSQHPSSAADPLSHFTFFPLYLG